MAIKPVPLLLSVLLATTFLIPGVAIASDCDTTRCGAGVEENGKCKTHADFSCDEVCNDNGCDGGDDVGGEFKCGGVGPWKMCQCNHCEDLEIVASRPAEDFTLAFAPVTPLPVRSCGEKALMSFLR